MVKSKRADSIFDVELNDLKHSILEMGGKVELMITNSVKSLIDRDTALAERTIAMDWEVNTYEVSIDERCLELLALRKPIASELRFITTSLKLVTDLERIGDKCANIAKRARELNEEPKIKPYIDIPLMGHWAAVMVKEALDAFVSCDVDLAAKVCGDDKFMNELNVKIQRDLLTYMMEDPTKISCAMKIINISKALDRIADHATNIAEMVIFMVKGIDIRHINKRDH